MPTPSTPGPLDNAVLSLGETALQRLLVQAIMESVPERIYFKDRNSRFIAVSRSKAAKHGLKPAEMVGKSDFDTYTAPHANPSFEDEQRIVRTGEPIVNKIEKETYPDGRVTWSHTTKVALRNEQGGIIGTMGISRDITELKLAELALEKSNKELVFASRQAGMAEVATGVLHNVGNVLNSLNVAATVVATGLHQSKIDSLTKVSALVQAHAADLGDFITRDPQGRLIPEFLASLAQHLADERTRLLGEVRGLQKNIDHIKDIVTMQQEYARLAGVVESLDPAGLMEDAVRLNAAALSRHEVTLVREFQPVPPVQAEKSKVLQILVNLIRNAKYALDDGVPAQKVMTLRVELGPPGWVHFVVADNGVGIPAENLTRIFGHGFTTRREGHGFGLHSATNAAREMKGALTVHSDGPGRGAVFTLQLPIAPEPAGE